MIKLMIKNPNGSIETKMLSEDSTFTPKAGQQFYFDNSDSSRKYTFNLTDGESSIELIFAGNGERLKFNLNGMADLIKQSDTVLNENTKTVLGIMNDEDGLKELNQTALNDNFQGDKVISELKQLLDDTNNPDEKYQNGIIIDDFGALAEQLDAAAAGAGPVGQNSGTNDAVLPTAEITYYAEGMGVGDTLDKDYGTVDLQGPTTDETPIPVYAVISGTLSLVEGETANYIIKLIDIDGNEVTVSQDTVVKIKFENITTQDDDTEYSNNQIIEVTINAGSSSTTLDVKTLDDLFAEEDEDYKLTIDSVDSTEFDDLRIEDFTSTTGTNYSITAETTITDEPEDEDDKVFVQLLGDDSVIEADGAELTHTIKLVDEQGNPVELPAGKTITLTLTYTPDATDGTQAEDFTSDSLETTITITGNGSSEYTITNEVVDDALAEDIESYTVTLTAVNDDDNYFEDLSVDAVEYDAIGSIVDEDVPPAQPQVSVDLEVDPGSEVLIGTANTSSVDVTITDELGTVIFSKDNVSVVNGVWDLSSDADFTALTFDEDEDYTATVIGELNGVEASDSDVDDYSLNTPNEPSVSVDLEVDPGAEKLSGTTDEPTNSVEVTITNESGVVIYTATNVPVDSNGNWDLTSDAAFQALEFNDEEEYTATAVATNSNGTATDSDVDEYKEPDTAYSLKLFAVVEVANPEYDAQTNPNVPQTIKTYVDANTIEEGESGTYVVLAIDENGTPLTDQPGGTITVKTGIDSDTSTEDAIRGEDYTSTEDIVATVGEEFSIASIDDIYAEEDEVFTLTLQEDWSKASEYEVIDYDKTPVETTITDNGNHPITANDDTITVCFTSYEAQAFNGNNFSTGNLGDEDDIGNATLKWNSQNQQVVETDLGLGVYGNINNGTTGTSDSLGIDDDETLVIKLSNPVEQAVFQINADVTDEIVYGAWTLFDENGEQVSVNTFFEIDSSGMLILSATDVNGDPVSFQYVSFEGKNEDQTASDLGYYVQPYGVDSDFSDDTITIDSITGAISVTILVSTILANDTDSDGDNSSLEFDSIVINSAVGGTAVYNNDGTITFTKDVDFDGIPSFDYSITDSDGNGTSSATVTLSSDCSLILRNPYFVTEDGYENIVSEDSIDTIDGIDDGLNASGNVITDNNLTGTVTQVNGSTISNPIVLTYGTLTMNEDGSFDYVVDNDMNEIEALNIGDSLTETFTYTLSDGTVETATIVIEGRDDAPIIQNITTADVNLNNDASIKYTLDVDGDGITDTLSQSALLAQDRGIIFEEDNGNLQINLGDANRDVAIEYHGGQAGLNNIFGYYELDASGNPTNFQILYVEDGTTKSTGGSIDLLEDLSGEIGFFLIPGGYNNSAIMDLVTDGETVSSVVNIDSSDNATITFTDGTVIEYPIYFTDNNLSSDGRDHAIAGISEDGTGITIGFEDLPENSTDQDYDDFVFTIKYCDTTGDNGQLFTNVNFTDVDDANLTSAIVTLKDAQTGDTLSIDLTELPIGIDAVISGNTITFTNVASLDDYEDAIEAIRFATTSSDRSTREFEIEISDGIKTDSITKTVNIIGCEIETYSPVYVKIVEADSVTEGDADNTLTHKVILVDAAGNTVTVPDGESLTVTLNYTDGTGLTNDDFTTARQVTVTINGGESEALVINYVNDDLIDENTESYTVEIASIDNNPFDTDLINVGTSTTGTIEDNDTITVDADTTEVDEDFIPNIGNETDPDTDLVANQYTDSGNITTTGGVTDVIFASGQTTTLTSEGNPITLTTSTDGKTITGMSGTTPIFTATISADGTSYDFVLQGNIDHPDMSSEDTLDLVLKIEATNGTNSVDDTLTVTIADDIPCANDSSISINLDTTPVNLIFTLDISGSMDDDVANTNGKSKLDIAIEAIEDLVASYEAQGKAVNIQLTTFSTQATEATVWMNSTQLSDILDDLSANGWTNYEDALQTTVSNYENSTVPTGTTYAYFLSDGNPTVEMNDSTTSNTDDVTNGNTQDEVDGSYIDDAYILQWEQFVIDNNISKVYAVGIGDDVSSSYLEEITEISNVIIVSEDNLVNLSATLQETVVYETGTLDFCFGADGAADGTDTKLDGDKLPFTWEVDNLPTSIVWILSTDGTVLTGTINNETVIKVEATDIYTDSPKYVITQLSENIGVDNLSLEYTVTDGDGDSVTAELNVDINIPVVYERDVITCEDTSYTFTLDDFDSSAALIRIDTLPVNGVLYLAGNEVHIGDIISSSDITDGNLTFEPDLNESGRDEYNTDGTGDQQNDYAEFNFSVNDGTSWISVNSTMTIDVSPVADAPTLSVLGIVGETTTIDVTNVTDSSGGYSVSAYKWNSTTNEYELATISEVSGTLHDGFGVLGGTQSGTASGDATEIGFDVETGKSEMIAIKFDNEIGSVDISYAWKHSYDNNVGLNPGETAVVEFYKDGVLLETQTHYDSTQTDTIDGPYTFSLSGGESFDEIRIYAQGEGDDFLIHDVTFTEIETSTTQVNVETGNTFDFEISSSLFDIDGSESLVSIVIDNIPEGMILSDGTNTFTSTSSNDSVDVLSWDLDAIKITVPSDLTAGDYDLSIIAKSQESLNGVIDSTCPLVAETSTTFKIIVSEIVDPTPKSVSESQDIDVCLTDTNLVITLDVSGSMTNDQNGWIDTDGDGHGDTTRLQLAKDAIIEMINKYSVSGTVMVQLTLFDSNANTIVDSNTSSTWMTATAAIDYIKSIPATSGAIVDNNQMTNYEAAINSTVDNYTALNNGAQTIAYFISDGSPTKEINEGQDVNNNVGTDAENGWLDSAYEDKWTNFVNSIDGVHAVGIGSGITNSIYLETMSVGTGAEYTDDLSIDSALTNGVGDSVTGNLLDNITWGTDSNGVVDSGIITSIIIDGVTYNASDYTDIYTFNTGQGEFEFNFTTGDYTYTNTESDVNNDYSEVIYLKATDSTGDETTYNLTVNVTLGECTISNPTPTNVILTDNEVVISDDCHTTTTSVSTSYTVYDSDDIDLGKFVTDGAKNIDSISLAGNSTTDILNIDIDDVVDLTDSDNELKIFGDDGDKVVLDSNSTWKNEGTQTIDGDTFNVYRGTDNASNIKILIDTDIDPEI